MARFSISRLAGKRRILSATTHPWPLGKTMRGAGLGRYDLTGLDGVAQMVLRADAVGSGMIRVQVNLPYDGEVHTQAVTGPLVEISVNP